MIEDAHRAYHEHLLGRMADVLGIDLDRALDLTRLSREELLGALTRCRGCSDQASCTAWLDRHAEGAEAPPRICPNRAMLEHLRKDA